MRIGFVVTPWWLGAVLAITFAGSVPALADTISALPSTLTFVEGSATTGVFATFTDSQPNPPVSDFTAGINWGDGTNSPGTILGGDDNFAVQGSHAYSEAGNYTTTVEISSTGGGSTNVSGVALVSDAPLSNGQFLDPGFPQEGTPFQGAIWTFQDGNPLSQASDFTAIINWGDGTNSLATITGSDGQFIVSGTHTYAEAGLYTPTATVVDQGGSTIDLGGSASVADAPLTGQAAPIDISAAPGTPFAGLIATFQDQNSLATVSDFEATIDWGDGDDSTGVVTGSNGIFDIYGSHTYSTPGVFDVSAVANDVDGSTATVEGFADIGDTPEPGTLGSAGTALLALWYFARRHAAPGNF